MKLFFRNDDLGSQPERLIKLLNLFATYGYKLNFPVIPISCEKVYDKGILQQYASILQIHTLGYAHVNQQGDAVKKSEYPLRRRAQDVKRELEYGKKHLEKLFPTLYYPAFIPPWNSFSESFLPLLPQIGYKVLSRKQGSSAKVPGLTEINIDFDLRPKELPAFETIQELWDFYPHFAANKESVGILLHHEYLEDHDFKLIKEFLEKLKAQQIQSYFLSELAAEPGDQKA